VSENNFEAMASNMKHFADVFGVLAEACEAAKSLPTVEQLVAEARRQALEEAAKVADDTMREEITGVQLGSSYRSGIRWAGERIKDAIRALASDALLDRQGNGKEG